MVLVLTWFTFWIKFLAALFPQPLWFSNFKETLTNKKCFFLLNSFQFRSLPHTFLNFSSVGKTVAFLSLVFTLPPLKLMCVKASRTENVEAGRHWAKSTSSSRETTQKHPKTPETIWNHPKPSETTKATQPQADAFNLAVCCVAKCRKLGKVFPQAYLFIPDTSRINGYIVSL